MPLPERATDMPEPTDAHRRLYALVGTWRTEGRTIASPDGPAVRIHGTDSYDWLPGKYFLVHRVDVRMGDEKVDAIEIIGYDAGRGDYTMHSYDHQGGTATMRMTERDGVWTIEGDGVRSRLQPDPDGWTMRAHWERQGKDGGWMPWMEIRLTRAERARG